MKSVVSAALNLPAPQDAFTPFKGNTWCGEQAAPGLPAVWTNGSRFKSHSTPPWNKSFLPWTRVSSPVKFRAGLDLQRSLKLPDSAMGAASSHTHSSKERWSPFLVGNRGGG